MNKKWVCNEVDLEKVKEAEKLMKENNIKLNIIKYKRNHNFEFLP